MSYRFNSKRPGQTLIEVVIATLIAAMTTVAIFSVILSSFVSQKKADKKEAAAMLLKEAQQTLQTFVSAVPNDSNYSPNAGGTWKEPGRWALAGAPAPGLQHDISSLMTAELRPAGVTCAAGASCYFTYTVTNLDCLGLGAYNTDFTSCKQVDFSMKYAD